jgi:hypothetical protein
MARLVKSIKSTSLTFLLLKKKKSPKVHFGESLKMRLFLKSSFELFLLFFNTISNRLLVLSQSLTKDACLD